MTLWQDNQINMLGVNLITGKITQFKPTTHPKEQPEIFCQVKCVRGRLKEPE